jgi:hypothetical protein
MNDVGGADCEEGRNDAEPPHAQAAPGPASPLSIALRS